MDDEIPFLEEPAVEDEPFLDELEDAGRKAIVHLRRGDSYVLVLVLLAITFFFIMATDDSGWAGVTAVTLEGATLLLALRVSRARRDLFVTCGVIVAVTLAVAVAAAAAGADAHVLGFSAVAIAFLGPVVVLRGLRRRSTKIDRETIAAALCIYLMIGLLFSCLYAGIAARDATAFNGLGQDESSDLLYFSFVTQATVGFGDITPASDMARAVAVVGGLIGQLYLVTVVALVVGNIGRPVARRDDKGTS